MKVSFLAITQDNEKIRVSINAKQNEIHSRVSELQNFLIRKYNIKEIKRINIAKSKK